MLVEPWTMLRIDRRRTGDGERRNTGENESLHANLLE
jgi:hypothetical protein